MIKHLTLAAALLFTAGCSDSYNLTLNASNVTTASQIQAFADQGWKEIVQGRSDFRGSLVLHIESAAGNYTVSSGEAVANPAVSHWRMASISKTFTAASILLLAQQGHINLDDNLSANLPGTSTPYLPATASYQIPNQSTITIRQMLQHRSGIFDVSNQDIPSTASAPYAGLRYIDYIRDMAGNDSHTFTFEELAGVVSANQLSNFTPGQQFRYSNEGYSLLAKIVEQASGLSFADYLQQNFFTPLHLTSTRCVVTGSDQAVDSPFTAGFAYLSTGSLDTTVDNMSPHVGEGSLISTPEDLAAWMRLLLSGQAGLNTASIAQMETVLPTPDYHGQYGLGLVLTPGLGYGHDGAHVGYLSSSRYDPETGTTFVIYASNLDTTGFLQEANVMYHVASQAKGLLEGRTIDARVPGVSSAQPDGD